MIQSPIASAPSAPPQPSPASLRSLGEGVPDCYEADPWRKAAPSPKRQRGGGLGWGLRLAGILLAFAPLIARAESLDELLAKGTVVLVENDAKGKFSSATGITVVNAPLEKVWGILINYNNYKNFIPKVVRSEVVQGAGTYDLHVKWEIDTPGWNTKYTVHYHLNEAIHVINAEWEDGALKDSKWEYRVEAAGPNKTIIYNKTMARHFSSILEGLEDQGQTITIGVNVGGALSYLKSIKTQAEKG
jgi:ribosome-associated toxin RatA of RatAB toxin-antitoxin module